MSSVEKALEFLNTPGGKRVVVITGSDHSRCTDLADEILRKSICHLHHCVEWPSAGILNGQWAEKRIVYVPKKGTNVDKAKEAFEAFKYEVMHI